MFRRKHPWHFTSRKPVHIDVSDLSEQLVMQGDETHIRQTIANLIDNAIKYSGEEVSITIQAASEARNVRVAIIGNGFGIARSRNLFFRNIPACIARRNQYPDLALASAM